MDFKAQAKQHALEVEPDECCGVVVNGQYVPCRNLADDPKEDFVMDPRDYAKALLLGNIEAVVHSHPKGGEASPLDKRVCDLIKVPFYIYLVPYDKWLTINPC
jgi:proteasome lid subunit RPN8/RPN11